MSSQRSAPPPAGTPGDSIPPGSDGRTSDTGIQRVTLPAAMPEPALSMRPSVVRFASGRSMTVVDAGGEERLEVRAAGGALVVAVRLTDEGPVFSMSGASIEIDAAKKLSLRADTVHLSAKTDVSIEAGGTLYQRAGGSSVREIAGLDRASAGEMEIEVHPGGISLRANDDVDIVGERVRLNSDDPPMPATWEEHRARRALAAEAIAELPRDFVIPPGPPAADPAHPAATAPGPGAGAPDPADPTDPADGAPPPAGPRRY